MKSKKVTTANSSCVLCEDGECVALTFRRGLTELCNAGLCPFYKNEEMERASEEKARNRCQKTGFTFVSPKEVNELIKNRSEMQERYLERKAERDGRA